MPYLVGGIGPGIMMGFVSYAISRPVISAYQKGRIKRMKKNFAKRRAMAEAAKQRASEAAKRKAEA